MSYFESNKLLGKTLPVARAAYSDRTSWLLAEISRLVYEPLPAEVTVKSLAKEIRSAIAEGKHENIVEALIGKAVKSRVISDDFIAKELNKAGFNLLEVFAEDGTEAILAELKPTEEFKGMLVLAFRGTQPKLNDFLTDLKFNLVSAPGGGRVHNGFIEAFENVREDIKKAIARHPGIPLYITGHSLGGALSMIAARYLGFDSTGAVYTYGSPRVADDEFFKDIKTPVYRVVNAADAVTRVPLGAGFTIFLGVIRYFPVHLSYEFSEWVRRKYLGYTHYGHMVFLNAPPNQLDENDIPFKGLKVEFSANIFKRAHCIFRRIITTGFKALASDHGISEYSQKLSAWALRRN